MQEKTAGLEQKNEILAFWQANRRLHSSARSANVFRRY